MIQKFTSASGRTTITVELDPGTGATTITVDQDAHRVHTHDVAAEQQRGGIDYPTGDARRPSRPIFVPGANSVAAIRKATS